MELSQFVAAIKSAASQHKCFYHFTDVRNLPSIQNRGLLSMRALRSEGVVVDAPGGNQWSLDADVAKGMDAYVHLCFTNNHPMEYIARREGRLLSTKFLKVKPEIILLPGVKITSDVSNKKDVEPLDATFIETLDLQVIYTRMNWSVPEVGARRRVAVKYELLVPNSIPVHYIENV